MLEPVYRADSKSAARKGMWVRLPPAAPFHAVDFNCVARPPDGTLCADVPGLGAAYVYLLGLYLGDGNISDGPRAVYRLRITLDLRYPAVIDACATAIHEVRFRPSGRVLRQGCCEVYSYWKHWPCLFPQHGVGPKHRRAIRLLSWQLQLLRDHSAAFLTGLIHSDGCRSLNRVKGHTYPRYFFSNESSDILGLFELACSLNGVATRRNRRNSVSVARRTSVAKLDALVPVKA